MKQRLVVATLGLILILPAALFMAAVFMQGAFDHPLRAEALVHWYAARMWTLWLLLFAMPCVAFVAGVTTLMSQESRDAMRAHLATFLVAVTTLAAGAILAVVVLHMAAN